MFIHSYHNGHKREAGDMDELGYSFNTLAMSPTDLEEMQRAYLRDARETRLHRATGYHDG